MKKKSYNVYAFKIIKQEDSISQHLKNEELLNFLSSIKKLPCDLIDSKISRYSDVGTQEERCLFFLDEIDTQIKDEKDYLPAVFIKRRGGSRPFEEDGHGNLFELKLSDDGNQIAEVGFIIFCIKNGIALWIYNPFVGGINLFSEYLNKAFKRAFYNGFHTTDFTTYGAENEIQFNYIHYPNAESDFHNNFFNPSGLEFNLAAKREDLVEGFLFNKNDGDEIKLIKHFFNNSNCAKLHINIASERPKKQKTNSALKPQFLNKTFITNLFEQTIEYLKKNEANKFFVKGKWIDDDLKVLDLINCKLVYAIDIEYDGSTIPIKNIFNQLFQLALNKQIEMVSFI